MVYLIFIVFLLLNSTFTNFKGGNGITLLIQKFYFMPVKNRTLELLYNQLRKWGKYYFCYTLYVFL